ncbi:hypothetical protein FB451DRAFT_1297329 [Mycena latifolia]|nr:hypothetical protein FB451DRAFT_1297329 [Mycena latifolia]
MGDPCFSGSDAGRSLSFLSCSCLHFLPLSSCSFFYSLFPFGFDFPSSLVLPPPPRHFYSHSPIPRVTSDTDPAMPIFSFSILVLFLPFSRPLLCGPSRERMLCSPRRRRGLPAPSYSLSMATRQHASGLSWGRRVLHV